LNRDALAGSPTTVTLPEFTTLPEFDLNYGKVVNDDKITTYSATLPTLPEFAGIRKTPQK
jgi:hypothetical protein